jgi:hypothetical protein
MPSSMLAQIFLRRAPYLGLAVALLALSHPAFSQQQARAQGLPGFREMADGVLFRSVQTAAPVGTPFEVEIWEILVTKGRAADIGEKLPGAAVLEVFSGAGTLRVGDKKQEIGPGAVIRVDERTPIAFDNSRGETPLEFRATLIRRRSP